MGIRYCGLHFEARTGPDISFWSPTEARKWCPIT